jgi:FIMAH domain
MTRPTLRILPLLVFLVALVTSCTDTPVSPSVSDGIAPLPAMSGRSNRVSKNDSRLAEVLPATTVAIITDFRTELELAVDDGSVDDDLGKDLRKELDAVIRHLIREKLEKALKALDKFQKKLDDDDGRGDDDDADDDADDHGGTSDPAVLQALSDGVARIRAALTGEVTPEVGGTVVAAGGDVELAVPAGAVTSDITITVAPIADPVQDPTVLAGTVYDFGPDGTQFATPVRVTLAYDPANVPSGLPSDAVFVAKLINGAWVRVPGEISVDPANGTVTAELTSFSQYAVQADACALRAFGLVTNGSIDAHDCVFNSGAAGASDQFEKFYAISTAQLIAESGLSIEGSPRLTFTVTPTFNAVIGFQEADPALFEGLIYRFRRIDANQTSVFTMYAGDADYKLFFGGQDDTQVGSYNITVQVEDGGVWAPESDAGAFAGSASFSSEITEANSYETTVAFGPFIGQPLFIQYRIARLEAGKSYDYTVSNIAQGETVVAFASAFPLSAGVDAEIDFGSGPSDPDRSITFTASQSGFYYFEVSGGPGVNSTYDLSFSEVTDYDACAAKGLDPVTTATISTNDCIYVGGNGPQYEDLYRVDTGALLAASGTGITGAPRLTFTADASFGGRIGVGTPALAGSPFSDLVFGSRAFDADTPTSFSLIAPNAEYLAFMTGADDSELGRYNFTVDVGAAGDFACGERVYLGGPVSFGGTISDGNACAGTIVFGPYAGSPYIYQARWAKLEEGKEYTVSLTDLGAGVDDGAVALFLWRGLGQGVAPFTLLDVATDGSDPDRSFTFVAPITGNYYLEVSSVPGRNASYTFTLSGGT